MRAGTRVSVVLVAIVGLTGCGGSDEPAATIDSAQRGVLETIDVLQTASRDGDGRRICEEVFTPGLAGAIKEESRRSCEAEVRGELFRPEASFSVERGVRVDESAAQAVIRDEQDQVSTLYLRKRAGRWQIERISAGRGA